MFVAKAEPGGEPNAKKKGEFSGTDLNEAVNASEWILYERLTRKRLKVAKQKTISI